MTDERSQLTTRVFAGDRHFRRLLAASVVLATLLCVSPTVFRGATSPGLRQAEIALDFHDYPTALRHSSAVLERSPGNVQALLIAGEACANMHESSEAEQWFAQIPEDSGFASTQALSGRGERLLRVGRVREAEVLLRRALDANPLDLRANRALSFLLQVHGRTWEAIPFATRLVLSGHFRGDELQAISLPRSMFVMDRHHIDQCLAAVPDDPGPLLPAARSAIYAGQNEKARETLEKIVARFPGDAEAQAQLGRLLLDAERPTEYLNWHRDLGDLADLHPEIWFNRALWCQRERDISGATRCCLETLRRGPNHVAANYQLSQLMVHLDQPTLADRFSQRANQLAKLEQALLELSGTPDLTGMQKTVPMLESLGRYWEAAGMCDMALRFSPDDEIPAWAVDGLRTNANRLSRSREVVSPDHDPLLGINIDAYPLPHFADEQSGSEQAADAVPDNATRTAQVRFEDATDALGLDFRYYNGTKTPQGLEHIFETTGGAVAVLDLDRDLWPDLHFAQGSELPPRTDDFTHRDRTFRNQQSRFVDVTEQAGLADHHFSQGVTIGDFDNDGFDDLYVGNIGPNRLHHNNGDGTFADVTAASGTAGDVWTMSCLMADLNGDALTDIYAVNYLKMQNVIDRRCRKNGEPLTCAPTLFPAEQDRLYLNLGDGRFEDVTETSGLVVDDGKGLGIVAADFDGSGRLSLFVGNDTVANCYFANQTQSPGGLPIFFESALLSGLGVDASGRAQATMGIATGDANGDGLVDLFTTNFYADANTLYLQEFGPVFVDTTGRFGLREPSFNQLGFGSQFIDGELDGRPDLVVVNGHVDRSFATGEPDEMPPQYFRNRDSVRFEEVEAAQLGPYFEGKYLGRSLTRIDWNRDGREEFCAGHLHSPSRLLTNVTESAGHFLVIRLVATESQRDAIGATVTVRSGASHWTQQLTAGDGYLSSNQRQLVFGLGDADTVNEVEIRWPLGQSQTLTSLQTGRQITIIQNRRRALELPAVTDP